MDWGTVFGPVEGAIQGVITSILPVAISLFVLMAGVGIAFWLFRKVGVRR